ncbi:phage tail protein [Mucilaginibacter mali]|uniref:Phage tail protein n=1 Tax=Mucilaginibacter mali TaxID=2740462 RepID=A0A7D4TNM6_9SPHI|nr:tail fiber protein [Mucilaginibacter mali]QKJ31113.1 phage tail protein [Mucilaginibacter mali]
MDAYYGEIRIFCGTYAPQNWAFCNGQIIPIQQNSVLFSILGATYGGNGTSTFGLPNLQGLIPVGMGTGPGLTPLNWGETVGSETYTLDSTTLPRHNHTLNGVNAPPATTSPANGFVANGIASGRITASQYTDNQNTASMLAMSPYSVAMGGNTTGTTTPVSDMQPFLPLNFIICLYGNYPPRP